MFLTKKHLSRRTALKGLGVCLALPLLDAMIPAATALAQTAAAPKMRAGFFYWPHGAIMDNTPYGAKMDHWMPSGTGADFKLSPILASLEKYKRYVTSFSNLEDKASFDSVHVLVPAAWLSGVQPNISSVTPDMAITLDQAVAKQIGQETAIPSLEMASETTVQVAACGGAVGGCYYSSTLSFRDPHTPLPMEYNPRKIFTQLFGEGDTAQERKQIATETSSLLDLISDSTTSLQRQLGAADRNVLANYLDTVREIERRIQQAETHKLTNVTLPEAPEGVQDGFDKQVELMFDLLALAYQADVTRVASYFMVSEGTNRTYNFIGVPDAFHPLSHHANDMGRIQRLVKIQTWHAERFAQFLSKLAATQDGDGSLLDHSIFLYGSNMSNSDKHNSYPLPNILVGGACGKVKGSQHIDLPPHTPLSNVLLTVLNIVGADDKKFGASTGTIAV
ncbi:MAG TPA: DUF1552 domain-containing protein [Steroidobacteraceae bacterium]|jgi:hypothetical protein|nr:DUF1552 domain-containing protein [Steroidobacteraceae bacterium]